MRLLLVPAVALLLVAAAQAEDVKSGLQITDFVGAYNVKDITGPNKGKSLCYRCSYGARPVVNIFAREVTPELATMIKQIDAIVAKSQDKKMAAFVTVLAEDADAIAPQLETLAKENGIKNVPLTIFDGEAGPEGYKISKNAAITVLMWNKSKVQANHGFAKSAISAEASKQIMADAETLVK